MLLGNKKTQKNDQNWCLILNPIFSEIDKRKVSRKISEAFSLSQEEAGDLVNNTPIILLDNLTRTVAEQVKVYFESSGAEMLMTNETYLKRKCYRTVWPEPPSLAFLRDNGVSFAVEPKEEAEKLPATEALDQIRLRREKVKNASEEENAAAFLSFGQEDNKKIEEELEDLKKERDNWRDKFNEQRRTLEKMSWDLATRGAEKTQNSSVYSRSQEIDIKQRQALDQEKEKYQKLRKEYDEARSVFEEKLMLTAREMETLKNKVEQVSSSLRENGREKEALVKRLHEQDAMLNRWQGRYQLLENEAAKSKQEQTDKLFDRREEQKHLESLQRDYEALKSKLRDEETRSQKLMIEVTGLREKLEEKKHADPAEIAKWQAKLEENAEKMRSLEKGQLRLLDELELRSEETKQWQFKCRDYEKALRDLQISHENLEKMLRGNIKQLETREKELESARRQLRDVQSQLEQQESIQRKTQLVSLLGERETRLKELVNQQEQVESEIRIREESIRKILAEQERVEKEILDAKQTQRHYIELMKKEKEKSSRVGISRRTDGPPETNPDSKNSMSSLDD